jgi:CRP-like cAMP-binding protein
MPQPQHCRPRNRLLGALPAADYDRLVPDLTAVAPRPPQILQYAGEPIRYVYFPNGGVFSVMTLLPDGATVEAATVGDEGMFCLEAFFRDDARSAGNAMMQVPGGDVARMSMSVFRREIAARGALHDLLGRYAEVAIAQMMQSAACNALHTVQARCARWLLVTHDCVHEPEFRLSHEFLAMMLGTRRPTVTLVARALNRAGLIAYRHGRVTVVNRAGLEAAACPCYAIIRAQFDRLRR